MNESEMNFNSAPGSNEPLPLTEDEATELKMLNIKQTNGKDDEGNLWTEEDFKRQQELESRSQIS